MTPSEILTAIREYPKLKRQYQTLSEQMEKLRHSSGQISCSREKLRFENEQLSSRNRALENALEKLAPRLNHVEQYRRLYKAVAPWLDRGGFRLYHNAEELTRFNLYTAFATEDNLGRLEAMNGHEMMRYLTASRFGTVEYEIIASGHEVAKRLHTDYDSPEYRAFEKKLYLKTLRSLGFERLLPPEKQSEKQPEKPQQRISVKQKGESR